MSNFTNIRNNLELKLLLLNTLEDFDESLASLLNTSISKLSDKDIVELIIDLRKEQKNASIISLVLKKLISKENDLTEKISELFGAQFIHEYLNK